MDERQQKAAERLYDLFDPWDRPDGSREEGINAIYNEISLDPVATINYLLDMIDEINA
jgi:hypothetical protein